jgi:hypothetical protein
VGTTFTLEDLWKELRAFEAELKQAGLRPSSIATYVGRTEFFLRWLAGDYHPTGPR